MMNTGRGRGDREEEEEGEEVKIMAETMQSATRADISSVCNKSRTTYITCLEALHVFNLVVHVITHDLYSWSEVESIVDLKLVVVNVSVL